MITIGKDEMAKYPFLADAGDYLKDKGFSLDDFGTDPDLRTIVDKALHRVKVAVKGEVYKSDIVNDKADKDEALPREVFSFLIAVVLLKLSSAHSSIYRFSMQESRRARKYLTVDLGARDRLGINEATIFTPDEAAKREIAANIIKEISKVSITTPKTIKTLGCDVEHTDQWLVPITEYVKRAVQIHEVPWKLVNRYVDNGNVYLSSKDIVRLIRAEIDRYIKNKISTMKIPPMLPNFEQPVKEIIEIEKKLGIVKIVSTEYPPCIKHAIRELEKGENLSHSGRFMLATFLLTRGQSIEQIATLFKNAPDYNEKITLYQLNHLAGSSGSETQYSCPSCTKLQSQNLCFSTSECNGIINPFHFGKKKTTNV